MKTKFFVNKIALQMNVLVLFIALLLFSSDLFGSDGKNKFETLWKEKGPHVVLKPLSIKHQLTAKEMNAFVYSKLQKFQDNKNAFWQQVNLDTGWNTYTVLSNNLEVQNLEYSEWLTHFLNEKSKNSSIYNTTIKTWEIASTPNPPSTGGGGTICDNVDFENPTSGHFSNWAAWEGIACFYEPTLSCNNFSTSMLPGSSYLTLTDATGGIPYDGLVSGNRLPQVAPGGNYSILLENQANGGHASKLEYTFTVDSLKPIHGVRFALVLEEPNGGHSNEEKPYFQIKYNDLTTNEDITCGDYRVVADAGDPEFGSSKFQPVFIGSPTKFLQWDTSLLDLSERIGHNIKVTFVVSDCALGGHLGYAYIDGGCFDDPVTVGPCLPDGTRTLSVNGIFKKYKWQGDGIVGTNNKKSINVNREGIYKVLRFAETDGCKTAEFIKIDSCTVSSNTPCILSINSTSNSSCSNNSNLYYCDVNFSLSGAPDLGIIKIEIDKVEHFLKLPLASPYTFKIENLLADGQNHTITISLYKDDYISEERALCTQTAIITAPAACFTPILPCENCIGGFIPEPGQTYALSAWVKEHGAAATDIHYNDPFVQIQYGGGVSNPGPFNSSGKIIEGWQRIYQEFTIPALATSITVQLGTTSGTAFFDDIRIYPVNGSMKSYVYDPVSLKLVAVMDENNYATLYEYDQEGSLIRTKKETDRGIVTISENRQSNPKK